MARQKKIVYLFPWTFKSPWKRLAILYCLQPDQQAEKFSILLVDSQERRWLAARSSAWSSLLDSRGKQPEVMLLHRALYRFHSPG